MTDHSHLAFVVRIAALSDIVGRTDIELAMVKGWKCIVKKGEFAVNELAVYCAIGSIPDKHDRVKTIAVGGIVSQGVLKPLSAIPHLKVSKRKLSEYQEDDSVAEEMNVTKDIPKEERAQYDTKKAHEEFPSFVPKTDSMRLQHHPDVFLTALLDKSIVITRKEDGCSCTFAYKDQRYMLCGRNYIWKNADRASSPEYFDMQDKYDLKKKLRELGKNIAIQGEIVGPKINGNRMKLKERELFVFDVYNIDAQQYYGYDDMCAVCAELGLNTVPLLYRGNAAALDLSVEGFLRMAENTEYAKGVAAEGIVVKSDDPAWRMRRVHFKAISNKYLLEHNL